MNEKPIVDAASLVDTLRASDVVLVDVRPPQLYARGHIPGAVNLSAILLGGPNGGVPAADALARSLGKLGITSERHIVAYDDGASPTAARLFWILSYYRHARISVLDGGIRAWATRGYAMDTSISQVNRVKYEIGQPDTSLAVSTEELLTHLDDDDLVVLDVRASSEYLGFQMSAARNGHIPNAVNVEWSESLEVGQGGIRLRSLAELEGMFTDAGVTPDRRIVVHCQSGNRAAHSFLTLKHLGYPHVSHYALGWQEWGNRSDTPVVTE